MSMKEKTATESVKIIWILWDGLIKVIKFAVELGMGIINFNHNYLDSKPFSNILTTLLKNPKLSEGDYKN